MDDMHDYYTNARNLAIDFLRKERTLTPETIREFAAKAANAQTLFSSGAHVDVEKLTAELRHLFSVVVATATVLDDPEEHQPWLHSNRATIQWRFWSRYVTYLERDFGMAPPAVRKLDELTDMILERLESPQREPPWDRRGMVVGSVQSGKTANYIGLINKAFDAGYKLVIVLAGIHSNLRAQTQLRVDEGVLGFDTQKSRRIDRESKWVGVGKLPGEKLIVHSLTNSAENGDFNKTVAETIGVMPGGDPVVLVVKKNSRLLGNLKRWVLHVAGSEDSVSGQRIVRNVPLLLIDDEADNASINTKTRPGSKNEDSVTAINGRIRTILGAFEKSAYVGYTATPFANIFINPESESAGHGEDLFPRSFIVNVKPPSNYIGPEKVFGIDGDPDAGLVGGDGLAIVREIDDFSEAFPPKHRKDHTPDHLPESLQRAIRCFVLGCAARRARKDIRSHNSMLVHVTRFVNVQEIVVELVGNELSRLQRRIEFGDGQRKPCLIDELERLWMEEFVPTTLNLGEESGPHVSWAEVREQLHPAASKIKVLPINGYAKEALDYKEHEADGLNVIAIGGDKLSRGLTLEGLSTSYFLRTSRMYDTLMQMGRWFGYRPRYLDLCRLFTTHTLKDWYRHIALAEKELRREFDYMVAAGLTPGNYGLRVRTHPDGMIVTALNKMSHGRTLSLSWAGILAQTTRFPKSATMLRANLCATETLLCALGIPAVTGGRETRIWDDATAEQVAHFVESLQFPPFSARACGEQLASFIRRQAEKNPPELGSWTVALVSKAQASPDLRRIVAGLEVGLLERTPESQTDTSFDLKKANILSPGDEALDFSEKAFDAAWFNAIVGKRELSADLEWLRQQIDRKAMDVAFDLTHRWQEGDSPRIRKPAKGSTQRPNGRVLRALRPPRSGLLLIYPLFPPCDVCSPETQRMEATGLDRALPVIGIALSFPTSETTLGVEYRVNKVWGAEMDEDAAYED